MKLFYRISNNSYQKTKLIGATKEVCLMNFCKAFLTEVFGDYDGPPPDDFVPNVMIICDNCERKTVKNIDKSGLPYTQTSLGNAGSLRKAIELAMEEKDEEVVYFCEDDYLHLGSAPTLLKEGARRADYVTLYDHPDKYTRFYNGGEISKVIRTASSHWRYTASTCMTFGTKAGILKEDKDVWFDDELTGGDHPFDHHIFTKLNDKGRRLAVPIPGVACHVDLTVSAKFSTMMMEHWAIDMMIEELEQEILHCENFITGPENIESYTSDKEALLRDKESKEKLMALDAVRTLAKGFVQECFGPVSHEEAVPV